MIESSFESRATILEKHKDATLVVMSTCVPLSECYKLNKICRDLNISCGMAKGYGLYGFAAVDFGDIVHIRPKDKATDLEFMVSSVVQENDSMSVKLHVSPDQSFFFFPGNVVKFNIPFENHELSEQYEIISVDEKTTSFMIPGTNMSLLTNSNLYVSCQPKKVEIRNCPFSEQIEAMYESRPSVMAACEIIEEFNNSGLVIEPRKGEHLEIWLQRAKQLYLMKNIPWDDDEEKRFTRLYNASCSSFHPINAALAAFMGELLKALSKQHMIPDQPMVLDFTSTHYIDALSPEDCSIDNLSILDEKEVNLSVVKLFGIENARKISHFRTLIVGAGALGCSSIMFARVLRLGCGSNGKIILVDNDYVSHSNLSRQPYFSKDDAESKNNAKAEIVSKKVKQELSSMHVVPRVSLMDSQSLYQIASPGEYDSLDCIVSAVDNIKARLFLDELCHALDKVLIDSGTNGYDFNTDVYIPYVTKAYHDNSFFENETNCSEKTFIYHKRHAIQHTFFVFTSLMNLFLSCKLREEAEEVAIKQFRALFVSHLEKVLAKHPDVKEWPSGVLPKPLDQLPCHDQLFQDFRNIILDAFDNMHLMVDDGITFNKDNKHHVRLFLIMNNCIAQCYRVSPCRDEMEVRKEAGMMPAIITSSACASALMTMNMIQCAIYRDSISPAIFCNSQLDCGDSSLIQYPLREKRSSFFIKKTVSKEETLEELVKVAQNFLPSSSLTELVFVGSSVASIKLPFNTKKTLFKDVTEHMTTSKIIVECVFDEGKYLNRYIICSIK